MNRFIFLDGLRGVAALFVVTRHTPNYWQFDLFRSYLAVDLFFILSGFVIGYAYDEKLQNKSISFNKFVMIRFIRLYPLFLLSIPLSSIVFIGKTFQETGGAFSGEQLVTTIIMSALFLPSFFAGSANFYPINGAYWSLFYELLANFVYASLSQLLNNRILLAFVVTCCTSLGYCAHENGNLNLGFTWSHLSILAGLSRSFFGIFLGLLLYKNKDYLLSFLGKRNWGWLGIILVMFILGSPSILKYNWLIDLICVTIIFPCVVIICAKHSESRWNKVLVSLGTASYVIYVLHAPLGTLLGYPIKEIIIKNAPLSGFTLLLILYVIAIKLDRLYDLPIRKWLLKKIKHD